MSKARAVKTSSAEEEKPRLALVEPAGDDEAPAPAHDVEPSADTSDALEAKPVDLIVYIDSLGVSMLDKFSLVRIFREEWRGRLAYYRSPEGGSYTLDEAVELATHKLDEQEGGSLFERLLTTSAEAVDFEDLHKMWTHSSADAEFIWGHMKQEARREFVTGHLAATVFEPVDWMRSAWKRAKFLGVRDSFIDEYEPEGGVEVALVDTMAQAYFLQLHWTEEAVRRTNTDPRRHSYEYAEWKRYDRAGHKARMWDEGHWEIPYASQVECQEQAVKMADHFSRLFQRTVRALDNHRLAKAKLRRLSVPTARRPITDQDRENVKEWKEELGRARKVKG